MNTGTDVAGGGPVVSSVVVGASVVADATPVVVELDELPGPVAVVVIASPVVVDPVVEPDDDDDDDDDASLPSDPITSCFSP